MNITPELIAQYKDCLMDPKKHGLSFKPINDIIVKSGYVTAQHVLYKNYISACNIPGLSKFVFYLLLQEIFGNPTGKDERGDLGYHLTISAS